MSGVILIRHGPKRERLHPLEQTPLSEEGIAQVTEFAKSWDGPVPSRILSSPIDRCMQTASLINGTDSWGLEVQVSRLLGNPGAFVMDSRVVSRQLKGLDDDGAMRFFREHIEGKQKEGMASLADGSKALLAAFAEGSVEGLVLAVSHDVIISALAAHLSIRDYGWPDPLCGLTIRF